MLKPFEQRWAGRVAAWATSAQAATWWAGAAYPVPAETVRSWQQDPEARGFLLFEGPEPVAYGEIWDDADEQESELAHLIVDPVARGRGLGQALVRLLAPQAGFEAQVVRVHPDNVIAQNCYTKAGFARVDEGRAALWNAPQPVAYVWLERARSAR